MKKGLSISLAVFFRSKIRGAFAAGILLVLAIVPTDAIAQRLFYRLTSIADTKPGFPWANLSQFPCQNSSSRDAFEALMVGDLGVDGMFSHHGVASFDTLADTGLGEYDSIGLDCTINLNGTVLFSALKKVQDGYQTLLLRGAAGTQLQTLLATDGTFDEFGGWQLSLQGTAVLLAERPDGSYVILTQGSGPLTGPQRIIADNRPTNSPYTQFGNAPSINNSNTVAFTVVRRSDGSNAIVTIAQDGTVTNLIDSTGPFAGFSDIDLNAEGSLAFDGVQYGGLWGVWRLDPTGSSPALTKITDSTQTGSINFTAVSINDAGQVAYSFRDPDNFVGTVGIGNGSRFHSVFGPGPIVLGPGAAVFGRIVASADIGRDSLNNFGQIEMHIDFYDGSQMIARAELVNPWANIAVVAEQAFALTTGTGNQAGTGTTVSLPPTLMVLSFDATFLTGEGELKVQLDDRLLTTVRASSRGVRQRIRIPIDLRQKTRSTAPRKAQELKFVLAGAPGVAAQISNISIPGGRLDSRRPDARVQWHFNTQSGGWAGLVDATRFPVQIKVLAEEPRNEAQAGIAPVAILSSASFDATRDIERDTLNFAGAPVRREPEAKGGDRPKCAERDVNGDKRPDLVCDFGSPAPVAGGAARVRNATLEAMTPYGWMIEGRAD